VGVRTCCGCCWGRREGVVFARGGGERKGKSIVFSMRGGGKRNSHGLPNHTSRKPEVVINGEKEETGGNRGEQQKLVE